MKLSEENLKVNIQYEIHYFQIDVPSLFLCAFINLCYFSGSEKYNFIYDLKYCHDQRQQTHQVRTF